MINKQDFFTYMSILYNEDYHDVDAYKTFKSITKLKDQNKINDLKRITKFDTKERLAYRHALAANGKELTPTQLDQYISTISFALSNMNT
jgi:hypothetical protein